MARKTKKGSAGAPTARSPAKRLPPVSEEDRSVWQAVKASVSPKKLSTTKTFRGILNAAENLPPTPKSDPEADTAARQTAPSEARYTLAPDDLLKGRVSRQTASPRKRDLQPGQLDGLDRKRGERLRKGKLEIEGTLDLHGMTRDRAEAAVRRFIDASQQHGRRTVLIITGKGYHHDGSGVLRTALPIWLNSSPLRGKIVAFDHAQPRHGGQGAYYVYIKKIRDRT